MGVSRPFKTTGCIAAAEFEHSRYICNIGAQAKMLQI